jgi:hypothetical protein
VPAHIELQIAELDMDFLEIGLVEYCQQLALLLRA